MGNQPSAPQTPQPQPKPQPLAPVCDSGCQRQKMLDGLKTTLDQKAETRDTDPEGYEQARIAYLTALHGQGWLAKEKERIAKKDVEPTVSSYINQYNSLKKEKQQNDVFVNMANAIKYQEADDEEQIQFLNKEFNKQKNATKVLNRLEILNNLPTQVPTSSGWDLLLNILIAILIIAVVYYGYSYYKSRSSVPVGGKRVPSYLTR